MATHQIENLEEFPQQAMAHHLEGFGYLVQTMRASIKPTVNFDGKNSVTVFLEGLEQHFLLYPVPERQKVVIATSALRGQAALWWKV